MTNSAEVFGVRIQTPARVTHFPPTSQLLTLLDRLDRFRVAPARPAGHTAGGGTLMDKPQVTQIPLPGGSGRVPTGAMQFRDDWPGLFLRGDDATVLMGRIRVLAEKLGDHEDPVVWSTLANLTELADLIERDVIVPAGGDR